MTVESIRNEENVVDIAALETGEKIRKKTGSQNKGHILENPVGEEEPAVAVPEMVADGEPELDPEDPTAPDRFDPPAASDNWANPTDGGIERNTEYTFFYKKRRIRYEGCNRKRLRTRNVSPTTQVGLELSGTLLTPRLRSKMAPRHNGLLLLLIRPALKSRGLIGHDCPPKDIDTKTFVLQAEQQQISEDEKEGTVTYGTQRTQGRCYPSQQIPE